MAHGLVGGILVPKVFFVEGDVVFGEELAEFSFEGFSAMVFALVSDVGGDGIELEFTEREGAVAGLP